MASARRTNDAREERRPHNLARKQPAGGHVLLFLSHGLSALLAFSMGQFWARTLNAWTADASPNLPRPVVEMDDIDGVEASPSSLLLLETPALLGTLIGADALEDRLGTGIPWIAHAGDEQGPVLLLRPAADASCQALDMVWLQVPTHAQDCLVILPWSDESVHPSPLDVSPHRLLRLAPERKGPHSAAAATGSEPWEILPWESPPDLVDHKPFRLETPPKPVILREAASVLQHYLRDFPEMLQILQPLAATVHRHVVKHPAKVLTILLSNRGHVDLLVNFVCGWKALSSDEHASNQHGDNEESLEQILVFAADRETAQVAKSLGLTVFFHPKFLGEGSVGEGAANYGTLEYARLMLAKIFCAHMLSVLGYDFVFHDVDIVPLRRDYLRPLLSPSGASHDVYDMHFQYDFAGIGSVQQIQPEYRPWLINSGLYFVRSNARTRDFFDALLLQVDLVLRSRSHQAVMTTLLGEHVSRYGLRVRVLRGEADNMPGRSPAEQPYWRVLSVQFRFRLC
jgi:hypothetical protein